MKTHNTVSIEAEGIEIVASARAFSIDGGREWRTGLEGLPTGMRDAIAAAMSEAARRDACDPVVMEYRRRPTTKSMPALSEQTINERDDFDERETLRPEAPQDLIATVVPPYDTGAEFWEQDEDAEAPPRSDVPTERPAVTEPVRSQERPVAGQAATPPVKKALGKD